ncbi:MAG: NADH-quinone oxidoreductase subunit NuoN [Neomegalonema sp.]|nr:NADH-quinone oxidoreductase subunit NuoN [Neomegalonema sp.]
MDSISADLGVALPEIALAIGGMALLMLGVFRAKRDDEPSQTAAAQLILYLATALLLAVGVLVALDGASAGAFDCAAGKDGGRACLFVDDTFSRFAKVLILFASAIMLILGVDYMRRHQMMQFEYPVLIVFAALGMCMMVSANDLMSLYMGLELQSLSLYVIAAFRRDSLRSTEAGLKYFVLGALSSGLLLYGASLIYGFTGSTRFDEIATAVVKLLEAKEETAAPIGLLFGLVFLASGLAFKISAAPFHMWTPDVYEGAPAPVTAFFATAPKVAALALFGRTMMGPFQDMAAQWSQVIAALAVASMFLGAFAGIGQTNIKRLMAYSSIGHMGFALVPLAAGTEAGVSAMLVYLVIYLATNVGVFAFILMMTRDGAQSARLADLDGLARTSPGAAAGLALLLFSLAGIPPLWGFMAKFAAFSAAVDAGLAWLAVAAVVSSVISAYYYLNIIRRMYFAEPAANPLQLGGGVLHRATFGVVALAMILAVAPFQPFNGFGAEEAASRAAKSLTEHRATAAPAKPAPTKEAALGAPAAPLGL